MKILIGTPIHINQDHLIEIWLKNVSELRHPADLFMVDTSPGLNYVERIEGFCKKYGIKNYKIEHVEVHQENGADERIGRSREVIRQEVLSKDYFAWFSWECDHLLPTDALDILVQEMAKGDYMMVSYNNLAKKISSEPTENFGCALVRKDPIKRYGFLLEYPDMPDSWYGNGSWFKSRLVRDGWRFIEIDIYNPEHLKNSQVSRSLKLNLGCGTIHKKGYINIDIKDPCDLKHDLKTPMPFADDSIDEIFTEGSFVCLFSYKEWDELKYQMVRVLKPGGKLEIECVDLEYVFKAFLKNKGGKRWSWWIKTIFASQENEFDFCKNGFTYDKLVSDLSEEGMINFSREPSEPADIHLVCSKQKRP